MLITNEILHLKKISNYIKQKLIKLVIIIAKCQTLLVISLYIYISMYKTISILYMYIAHEEINQTDKY